MQGLADGYFVLPYTIANYLADPHERIEESHPAVVEAKREVEERINHFLTVNGTRSVNSYHKELGHIMWEYCGMERTKEGLTKAVGMIREPKADFWKKDKVQLDRASCREDVGR